MKLPNKITTQELADLLGVTRQTINRWIREQNWQTEKLGGVKGGRARVLLVTKEVRSFLKKIRATHDTLPSRSLHEPAAPYYAAYEPMQRIIKTLQNLTADEATQLEVLLAREGIHGLLSRLGIPKADEA